jgi:sugar lactone lactonase YvrE
MRVFVSPVNEQSRFLPEGPRCAIVDGREALVWVNIQTAANASSGSIHLRFWDNGELRELPETGRPGFVLPTYQGHFAVVGREKEIGLLDLRTNAWTSWATIPDANPRTIINDGEVVPGGRAIVFGTKDVKFADPIAQLYLFTTDDRRLTIMADRQLCSNGKVFANSPSGLFLFDIDTPKRNVVRYRLDLDKRRWAGNSF